MKVVLDTSVLIDLESYAYGPSVSAAISVLSLSELHFGVLLTQDPEERANRLQRLAMIESSFWPLPVDPVTARRHGEIQAAAVAAGRKPRRRQMDLLIAATASVNKATLATVNIDDFLGLERYVDVVHPDDLPAT